MTFTYAGALATEAEEIRLAIGDTQENDGPRPYSDSASNFSDAEVAYALSEEGSVGKAAAYLCEVLAREWASEAGTTKLADFSLASQQAAMYRNLAADLRRKHGGGRRVTQATITRVDGFSDDVDAEET